MGSYQRPMPRSAMLERMHEIATDAASQQTRLEQEFLRQMRANIIDGEGAQVVHNWDGKAIDTSAEIVPEPKALIGDGK